MIYQPSNKQDLLNPRSTFNNIEEHERDLEAREVRVEIRDATRPPPPLAAARGEEREERRRRGEEREGRETARGRGRKAARKREKESTARERQGNPRHFNQDGPQSGPFLKIFVGLGFGVLHEACETKLDPKEGFYTCNDCGVVLHVSCVFGDFSYFMPCSYISIGTISGYYGYIEKGLATRSNEEVVSSTSICRPVCYVCHSRCKLPSMLKVSKDGGGVIYLWNLLRWIEFLDTHFLNREIQEEVNPHMCVHLN
ncbi:hypothetical protein YC2023_081351 [Brassica napus]